jgi:hypothetical protein
MPFLSSFNKVALYYRFNIFTKCWYFLPIAGAFTKTFINIFMEKYIGFVFETTNIITGMKFIGSHIGTKSDIDFGNSKFVHDDIKKYGVENLKRAILEYATNVKKLEDIEHAWITKLDAKNNPMYYNDPVTEERGSCRACFTRLVAVNYHYEGKAYYRKLCSSCIRKSKKIKPEPPEWFKAGYKKRDKCENCGFKAQHLEQLRVFYLDGNKGNNNGYNLKTICLNCQVDAIKSKTPWKPADIIADF